MSFSYTNVLRDGLLAGLGTVPAAGSLCQFLAIELWPASNTNHLEDLNAKLSELTIKIEQDTWVTLLNTELSKMREAMQLVKNAISPSEMDAALRGLWKITSEDYEMFVRPNNVQGGEDSQPQNTVTLLVAYGTIHLGMLRERALHYEQIFGQAPNGNAAAQLQAAIAEITAKVKLDRDRAISWRQNCLSIKTTNNTDWGSGKPYHIWDVSDAFDHSWDFEMQAEDDDENNPTSQAAPEMIQAVNNRHFDIQSADGGYASNLDQLLDAWRFWKYLDPAVPWTTTPGYRYWCNRIGDVEQGRTGNWFNDKTAYQQNGTMSGIKIFWDDGALKGIQAQYGGIWGPFHGKHDGNWAEWDLGDANGFIYIEYSAGEWVGRFGINSADRIAKNLPNIGRSDCADFCSLPCGWPMSPNDRKLAYIAGVTDGDVIGQLKVVWQQGEQYTTDLPQEHTSDAINDGFW